MLSLNPKRCSGPVAIILRNHLPAPIDSSSTERKITLYRTYSKTIKKSLDIWAAEGAKIIFMGLERLLKSKVFAFTIFLFQNWHKLHFFTISLHFTPILKKKYLKFKKTVKTHHHSFFS